MKIKANASAEGSRFPTSTKKGSLECNRKNCRSNTCIKTTQISEHFINLREKVTQALEAEQRMKSTTETFRDQFST